MANSPAIFAAGDEVEVICQDEGFKGSLYEARIIQSMPNLKRYSIEYETLMDESAPAKNLREDVYGGHLRPRPPCRRKPRFVIGEKVDALHNDGWWIGEISKIVEEGERYGVRFDDGDGGKEELEFGVEEIRVHMDWIHEAWILPPVPSQESIENLSKMGFKEGAIVEVNSDDEGFRGAWFTATIIGSHGKDFLVEYQDLRTDDEIELLKETVDSLHIRPVPPVTPAGHKFKLLEEVDAFCNDGWWVGLISKVLDDRRYMVYFKSWNEESEFEQDDLRLHHEWIDGKWIRAFQALDL